MKIAGQFLVGVGVSMMVLGLAWIITKPRPNAGFILQHEEAQSLGNRSPVQNIKAKIKMFRHEGVYETPLQSGMKLKLENITVDGKPLKPSTLIIEVE